MLQCKQNSRRIYNLWLSDGQHCYTACYDVQTVTKSRHDALPQRAGVIAPLRPRKLESAPHMQTRVCRHKPPECLLARDGCGRTAPTKTDSASRPSRLLFMDGAAATWSGDVKRGARCMCTEHEGVISAGLPEPLLTRLWAICGSESAGLTTSVIEW